MSMYIGSPLQRVNNSAHSISNLQLIIIGITQGMRNNKSSEFSNVYITDYVSWRHSKMGSPFIRALVATFYELAGEKHAVELSEEVELLLTSTMCM